jgi:hypothetical protein
MIPSRLPVQDTYTHYLVIPIDPDPQDRDPNPGSAFAWQQLSLSPPSDYPAAETLRRHRVNSILYPTWGITLDTIADFRPPSADPQAHVTLDDVLQSQPFITKLITAGAQPNELQLVLSWFFYTPVLVSLTNRPIKASL